MKTLKKARSKTASKTSRKVAQKGPVKKKHNNGTLYKDITNFIYEAGNLAKTPRSGFWLLGSGTQSVAEHTVRTIYITYCLCKLTPNVDFYKAVMMALVHDFGEGRTSDHNYVHQKYGRLSEDKAMDELSQTMPFGDEIKNWYKESGAKVTMESKLVKDADQLEWLASLREEESRGNTKAHRWALIAEKRIKTEAGKKIAKMLLRTHPDEWWFDAKDPWWVDRNKK